LKTGDESLAIEFSCITVNESFNFYLLF